MTELDREQSGGDSSDSSDLFRSEALLFSAQKTLGRVSAIRPLALSIITGLILLVVVTSVTYLIFGEYSRTERVVGYLELNSGRVDVFPFSHGGVVEQVFTKAGEVVEEGSPLVVIKYPRSAASGSDLHGEVITELSLQREQLTEQIERHHEFSTTERRALEMQLRGLRRALQEEKELLRLQQQRTAVSDRLIESLDPLRASKNLSDLEWLQAVAENLQQAKELAVIRQGIIELESAIEKITVDLEQLDIVQASRRLETELRLSEVNQQVTEMMGRQKELVTAPISGRVAATQLNVGATAEVGKPLMTIMPNEAKLVAVLLIPSSAVGFLEVGQDVHLMYDAYPFQQFGTHTSTLAFVSDAPIWAEHLRSPLKVEGPVFVARAELKEGTFLAMGEERVLQAGMLVAADVILERRSIAEWMLEPFFSLRGRN